MKRALLCLLLAMLLLLCGCQSTLRTQEVMTFDLSGGTAVLVRFSGGANDLTVPEAVDGCPVAAIAEGAFTSARGLASIVLPASLERVEAYAFAKCTALVSVTFSGEQLVSLGEGAFAGCHALESVLLPQGLKEIGREAFSDCRTLRTVHLPDTLRSIGARAFSQCPSLEEVQLPPSLKELGEYLFAGCADTLCLIVFEGTPGEAYARDNALPYLLED